MYFLTLMILTILSQIELLFGAANADGPCQTGAIGELCENEEKNEGCNLVFPDAPVVNKYF